MGSSSIKINSISIDLSSAANEVDMVKCDHFSIRKFVAETREKDQRKCWPFSEKSLTLVDQQSYSLPPLTVPKFRWWSCTSCIKDIDANVTKECGEHSNSRAINETNLVGNSTVIIPSNSLAAVVIDRNKEKETVIPVNVVVEKENEDVNRERPKRQEEKLLACAMRSKSRKLTSGPEQASNKRSSSSSKEKANKSIISSCKEKQNNVDHHHHQAVTTFGSSEIAGVVEDSPPKAIKNHHRVLMESDNVSSESINLATSGSQQPRKTKNRKVRLLSELLRTDNNDNNTKTRKEESSAVSKRESVRGRKRKLLPDQNNYVSRKLSRGGAPSDDQGDHSESTDSGFDRDPIKGKQKNRRFQVVDEFVPSQEGINHHENGADKSDLSSLNGKDSVPCPLSTQRTEKKLGLANKKNKKTVIDNAKKSTVISFSTGMDQAKPQNGHGVSQSSTRDFLNEKRTGRSLLDDRLASEGYFRKPVISLAVQDNGHSRPRDAEIPDFGASSSKSNAGNWLTTGVDVAHDLSRNNNDSSRPSLPNFMLRNTTSSTEVADRSCVLQKDATSGADRKGKTVMVQEHHIGEAKSQSHDTPEEQNDDIPMEIVELMAKNQYERCLPDKEDDVSNSKQPSSQETPHKSKNGLLIDLNETYDNNGISMEDNNNNNNNSASLRQPKPSGNNNNNARKDQEHFLIGKQQKSQSLDFFPITQPTYAPSPLGIFPLPATQENRATTSIRFSGQNCQWLGNVLTMASQNPSPSPYRVLRACPHHQYREASSHPIWPSSMTQPPQPQPPQGYHQKQVSFNINQSTNPGYASSSNEHPWNLNFLAANGKQKCGSINSDFSFGCKHSAAGASTSSIRPVDDYSREGSIPALSLLSLMDPRLKSNTLAERRFPLVNPSNELQTGDSSKSAFSTSKQLPFDLYSKRFAPPPEPSRTSFPIGPPLGTSSSFSFHNAPASWTRHQEGKTNKKYMFSAPVYNRENQVFASSSSGRGENQGKFQLLGASNSMMLPLKSHVATDKEKKQKRKPESYASAGVMKSGSGVPIECSVNRNPADFTIPEAGNVYMITGESLKVRKRATFKRKPSLCKQDAMKQNKKPVGPATGNA